MSFVLKKKVDLSDLSDDWKDCYIELREPTTEEVQRILPKVQKSEDGSDKQLEVIQEFISKCFIGGKGFDGDKKVEIKKKDIGDLPITVYRRCFDFLVGEPSAGK